MSALPLDVLLVSAPTDPHAGLVVAEIHSQGYSVHVANASTLAADRMQWTLDGLVLTRGSNAWVVSEQTTVWWRRPGQFEGERGLQVPERELARDECAVIFPGALMAAGPRWVDEPWSCVRAGNRLFQLRTAVRHGVSTPDSMVSNDESVALAFIREGRTLAKTISTGPGLAPFVDLVTEEMAALVNSAPVLLQRAVDAFADWRVLAVGNSVLCWSAPRALKDPVDWRRGYPDGRHFEPTPTPPVLASHALTLNRELGLTMSVQDWLLCDDGFVFLEANPQGQWLFLRDSEVLVPPVLAAHLVEALT